MSTKLEKASSMEDELRRTIDGYEKKLSNLAVLDGLSTKARMQMMEKPKPPPTPPPPLETMEKSKPSSPPVLLEKPKPPLDALSC